MLRDDYAQVKELFQAARAEALKEISRLEARIKALEDFVKTTKNKPSKKQ